MDCRARFGQARHPTSKSGDRVVANRFCGSQRLEVVRVDGAPAPNCRIEQITRRFSDGREIWGALYPPHGKGEGERHQWLVRATSRGQDDTQSRGVARAQTNPVEPVSDINFRQPNRSVPWVGVDQSAQDALERLTKLHGFRWREAHRFVVDTGKGVVDDEARPPVPLWDNPQRRQAEVREERGDSKREHGTETLRTKLQHLFADKLHFVLGGPMRAARCRRPQPVLCPRSRPQRDTSPAPAQMVQQARCFVWDLVYFYWDVRRPPFALHKQFLI